MDKNIEAAVVILATLKAHEALLKDHGANIEKNIAEAVAETAWGKESQRVKAALSDVSAEIAEADQLLRGLALDVFNATDNKHPHPAVTVKMFIVLRYDPDKALDFARDHLPKALKLDKRTFERAAKAIEPDFVTIAKEPKATIDKDLSEWATPTAEASPTRKEEK